MPVDYAALAEQARKSAPPSVDYAALAEQARQPAKPYDATARGAKAKGTPTGLDDSFMGTITKDLAAFPEGVYNAVTHPIDTVKGAIHQLANLPGDVMTDISQGNWGKLAAKFTELAVPALSTEKGLAAAGKAGAAVESAAPIVAGAVKGAVKTIPHAIETSVLKYTGLPQVARGAYKGGKAALEKRAAQAAESAAPEAAAAPIIDPLRPVDPGASTGGQSAADMLRDELAAKQAPAPAAAEAAPAPPAPPATPGEILARQDGQEWTKLRPEDKANYEAIARARENVAAQPPQPPPVVEPPAPAPNPTALEEFQAVREKLNGKPASSQIAEQLKAEMEQSGTAAVPPVEETPSPRVVEIVEGNRAKKTADIAQKLHDAGITSERLNSVKIPQWQPIAQQIGYRDISDVSIAQVLSKVKELEGSKPTAVQQLETVKAKLPRNGKK